MRDSIIYSRFEQLISKFEGRIAAVDSSGKVYSYTDLLALYNRVRWSAAEIGLSPSHRVALLLPDELTTALLALALAHNLSVLPLNPTLTNAELAAQIREAGVHAIIAPAHAGRAERLARDCAAAFIHFDASCTLSLAHGSIRGQNAAARSD